MWRLGLGGVPAGLEPGGWRGKFDFALRGGCAAVRATTLRLSFRATLRRFTRINGISLLGVPFGDPKGTEKVPATSDSAGGPA